MLSKFGMQIVFDVLNYHTSSKWKPGVDLGRRGRHIKNRSRAAR